MNYITNLQKIVFVYINIKQTIMEDGQNIHRSEIISNQEVEDEERRRDWAIQVLDITNMNWIILEQVIVIGENWHIFEQIVKQVNLSRGLTITNYIYFNLKVPENSTSFIVEERGVNEYVSYCDTALRLVQNRLSGRPGWIRQSAMGRRQNVMIRRTDNVTRSFAGISTNSLFVLTMIPTTITLSIIGNNQQINKCKTKLYRICVVGEI